MKEEGTNWQGLVDRTTLKFNSLVSVFFRFGSIVPVCARVCKRGVDARGGRDGGNPNTQAY